MKTVMLKTVMFVFGTRPEAVKMAPLIRAFSAAPWCRVVVVVTAQHREMLDQVLTLFDIHPHHDLNILRQGQTLPEITMRVIEGLDPILAAESPDALIVQGDTTTTAASALAAFYRQVPVVHVEAGLRTGDRYSPFPEEMNRRLTTNLASLHLAATAGAAANLRAEGVPQDSIRVTGNTVIDALRWVIALGPEYETEQVQALATGTDPLLLVTAHRRESWGAGMVSIGQALADLAVANPKLQIVFPIHRNPLVRDAIIPNVAMLANVHVVEPLEYRSFSHLMLRARIILTDSGGVQEEAPSLGKPVLVMRESTERPEALVAGTAMLVGTDRRRIVDEVQRLLDDELAYQAMATAVNPYGDGQSSARIVAAVAAMLGTGVAIADFAPGRAA